MKNALVAETLRMFENQLPYLKPSQRLLLRTLLALWGRLITVENGASLLKTPDPVIFALNHNNYLESLLVPATLIYLRQGRGIHFVIDWMFGRLPVLSYLLRQIDPIYVYTKPSSLPFLNQLRRHAPRNTVITQCINYLSQNQSIGIFPEGTRNPRPDQLLKAHPGIGEIALSTAATILPIGIYFPQLKKKDKIPELGPMVLRIGAPLTFAAETRAFKQLENLSLNPNARRKIRGYLSDRITYRTMTQIAQLAEKTYPYPSRSLPPDMSTYIPDELIQS